MKFLEVSFISLGVYTTLQSSSVHSIHCPTGRGSSYTPVDAHVLEALHTQQVAKDIGSCGFNIN